MNSSTAVEQMIGNLHLKFLRGDDDKYIPSEQDIARIESTLGSRLPEDYRWFALRYGITGSRKILQAPMPNNYPHGSESNLWAFYGPDPDDYLYGLEHRKQHYKGELLEHLLPIATFTNAEHKLCEICISTSDDFGHLFVVPNELIWADESKDYDESEDEANEQGQRVIESQYEYDALSFPLSTSFSNFLSTLRLQELIISPKADPVDMALMHNDLSFFQDMAASGQILTWRNEFDQSLCQRAALIGNIEVLQFLIDSNSDITGALSCAASNGYLTMMKFLLERGADPNEQYGYRNRRALFYANNGSGTLRHSKQATELLLAHGADPNAWGVKLGQ